MGEANSTDPLQPLDINHGQVFMGRPFSQDGRSMKITDLIQEMLPAFAGNETETNWKPRQLNIIFLRRLTCSNAPHKYNTAYVTVIKGLNESIIKAAVSLRTTLSTHGMKLLSEAVVKCGSDFDSLVDITMHTLRKQCGNTKTQTAVEANHVVHTILTHTSFTPRLLSHLADTMEEKSKALRGFAVEWLDIILAKYIQSKHMLEEKNGTDLIEKIVRKGLTDADATVRTKSEGAYWSFATLWSSRGEVLLGTLPATKQKSLMAHSPNANLATESNEERPGSKGNTTKRPATAAGSRPGKSSIREHIRAQKKAIEQTAGVATDEHTDHQLEHTQSTTEQRPKSAGSVTGAAVPAKPIRPAVRPIPARPKTAAATASSSVGTLSSAPKRPIITKKAISTMAPKTGAFQYDTARDIVTSSGPKEVTSTKNLNITTTVDPKRGRPLTAIANPPESPSRIPISAKMASRSVSPASRNQEVSGTSDEPELTSGFVRVLRGLVSDQSCQVPNDALGVLAKALRSEDVATRREGVELGVSLHKRLDHAFFDMVPNLESSERDLLLYYIAKRT